MDLTTVNYVALANFPIISFNVGRDVSPGGIQVRAFFLA